MSLAADLRGARPAYQGPRCGVAIYLETLSPEDRDALIAALDNGSGMDGTVIWAAMRANEYKRDVTSVQRHRRGSCLCPKS